MPVGRMMPRTRLEWVEKLAGGGREPAGRGHGRPARRGGPQLPAVGAPAGGDDVGTAGPAAAPARPAAPGVTAAVPRRGRAGPVCHRVRSWVPRVPPGT